MPAKQMKNQIVPFEIKGISTKEEDPDNSYYIVEGYASIYGNVDLGNDVMEHGAFSDDLKANSERPILWQHSSMEPIGVGSFSEDGIGLKVIMRLPMCDDFVKSRVMPQVKAGSVTGMSVGYGPEDWEYDDNTKVRRLKRCKLYENSLVTFPMNPKARITSKAVPEYQNYDLAPEDVKWDKKKAVRDIRQNTGSKEDPSKAYKKGFLFYDEEEQDSFGGYSLPYVYWDNGAFKAVPRGLAAVVGAMAGARSGIKLPDEDKEAIQEQINKYYKKMGREEPFKKSIVFIDDWTLSNMEKSDMTKIFDKNIELSTKAKGIVVKSFLQESKKKPEEKGTQQDEYSEMLSEIKSII